MLKVAVFSLMLLSMDTGEAARMLAPGRIILGFRIPGLTKLGPLEENGVTIGAVLSPITVPPNKIAKVGVEELVSSMYALIFSLAS
ncbi:hypothetical protein ACP275_11G088500 [Erythranthe tilingii]